MNRLAAAALTVLACLPAVPAGAREEPPRLRHNPFAVPAEFASQAGTSGQPLTLAPENLALHAIIPGPPERALVSLNGRVMAIGDTYSGYELVSVTHERARFRMENGSEFELVLRAVQRESADDGPIAVPAEGGETGEESETGPESGANADEEGI